RLQVDGCKEPPSLDPPLSQQSLHHRARSPEPVLEHDSIYPVDIFRPGLFWRQTHADNTTKPSLVPLSDRNLRFNRLRQLLHLRDADGRLHIRQPVIEPDLGMGETSLVIPAEAHVSLPTGAPPQVGVLCD